MLYRNHEGYYDPTAGGAISSIRREEKALSKKMSENRQKAYWNQKALLIERKNQTAGYYITLHIESKRSDINDIDSEKEMGEVIFNAISNHSDFEPIQLIKTTKIPYKKGKYIGSSLSVGLQKHIDEIKSLIHS